MTRNKKNDAMYVTEDTSPEDILEYVRKRATNPKRINGKLVWNFSSYEIDEEGLDLSSKKMDEFVIPYSVTGTWGFMYALLPERIREAELLVWRTDVEEYYAYRNQYAELPQEQRDEYRRALAKELSEDYVE